MKPLLSLCILVLIALLPTQNALSQFKLSANQSEGKVFLKDGTALDGIIELPNNRNNPWLYQRYIKFFLTSDIKDGKVKRKYKKKYSPTNILGFATGDRTFESKYFNSSINNQGEHGNTWNYRPNSSMFFMEKVMQGDISLYKLYFQPTEESIIDPNVSGNTQVGGSDPFVLDNIGNEYRIFIQKEEGSALRNVTSIDIYDYISDCESVKKKYLAGVYGPDAKPGYRMLKGLFIGAQVESRISPIITDYNLTCKQ